jgi:hypothetical protein
LFFGVHPSTSWILDTSLILTPLGLHLDNCSCFSALLPCLLPWSPSQPTNVLQLCSSFIVSFKERVVLTHCVPLNTSLFKPQLSVSLVNAQGTASSIPEPVVMSNHLLASKAPYDHIQSQNSTIPQLDSSTRTSTQTSHSTSLIPSHSVLPLLLPPNPLLPHTLSQCSPSRMCTPHYRSWYMTAQGTNSTLQLSV